MIRVERIAASQAGLLKELRCRALAEAPYAFGGKLEDALQWPDARWQAWAENCSRNPKSITFIAYCNDEPCGLLGCDLDVEKGENAILSAFWVAPEYRRLNVGQSLLEATKGWARDGKARFLQAWVSEGNAGARVFYQSAGFQDTGQRELFKSDSSQEQILLSLALE